MKSKIRVLLVEDNPINALLARALLVLIALHVAAVIFSSRRDGQSLAAAGHVN